MKRAVVALAALLLAACGSRHVLPVSGPDEVRAAAREIAAAPAPAASARDPAEDAALFERATARVLAAAEPLCAAYLREPCGFSVRLDAADATTARAEASLGRRITVSAGMLRLLDGEAEVALVIAHEAGHHLAGHLGRNLARGTAVGTAASAVVGALVPFGGLAGFLVGQATAELGAAGARLAYSREEEREADYLAAYLLARAGYDVEAAGRAWFRLARASAGEDAAAPRETATLLDSHPTGAERLAAWRRAVAEVRASPDLVPRLLSAPGS